MKTILVVTHSNDKTADYIIQKYNKEARFFRLDVNRLDEYEIELKEAFFRITRGNETIKNEDIGSVYYRKVAFPNLALYNSSFHSLMQREIMTLVEGIVETLGVVCLTRPSVLKRAENKIVQLKLASQAGLMLPPSLITNSAQNAACFSRDVSSIVKPLSVGRVIGRVEGIIQTNMVDQTRAINDLSLTLQRELLSY